MATTFCLIRHAEHGLQGRPLVGRAAGVGLSPEGERQARALADRLAPAPITAVYTSPLERAQQTAAPLAARLGLVVRSADELNELDFGAWTGKAIDELDPQQAWRRFNVFRSGTRIPDGELMLEAQTRIVGLMLRLAERHANRTVALVSHGDVIKAALCYFLGMPLDLCRRIEIGPASLSIVRLDPWEPQVLLVNGRAAGTLYTAALGPPALEAERRARARCARGQRSGRMPTTHRRAGAERIDRRWSRRPAST